MQPHLMTSQHALDASGSTVHFGSHPSSVFVQQQSSELSSLIWGHMDWSRGHLDTLLVWYTLRVLLFVGGKVSCAHVPFRVNSSFLTPLMFPSLVVLSYYSTDNLCVISIILCTNCISACMTLLSSDTLPKPAMHFLPFPANSDTISHLVNERNIGSALDFADPNAWLIAWAAR